MRRVGEPPDMASEPMSEAWCSPRPEDVAALLPIRVVPWWIAGGWAIELFVARRLRTKGM